MSGQGLAAFLISTIGLCIVVGLFFYAIDYISKDPTFNRIARLCVGGAAGLIFLVACVQLLFGGGGAMLKVTPGGVITMGIAIIVALLFLYIVNYALTFMFQGFAEPISFIVGGLVLIALLVVASKVLTGGGLEIGGFNVHSQIEAPAVAA
jgi:hypothetical protein